MQQLVYDLKKDGFTVFKCDVNKKKLAEFRKSTSDLLNLIGVKKHSGTRLPFAFKYCPESIKIFDIFGSLKENISKTLECENWVLTGHCDLHKNALSGWHRDDGTSYNDGGYFGDTKPDYTTPDMGVFKVAVYLQSHDKFEDGITVEPGSHIHKARDPLKAKYLNTSLGQVVIFDQRLWHTGQLKGIPNPLNTNSYKVLQKIKGIKFTDQSLVKSFDEQSIKEFEKIRGNRMSVFFTVRRKTTNESDSSITFERNNMKRQVFEMAVSGRSTFQSTSYLNASMLTISNDLGVSFSKLCKIEV